MTTPSFSIQNSLQFKVEELTLVTDRGKRDITSMYEELNFYDSMFMPVMSGKMLIRDSYGMANEFLFDGSETLLVEISKDETSDAMRLKKAFRIYRMSDRMNEGLNSESYVLHFVSDELIYSDQQRINQSYEMTYSEMVKRILSDYLKVPTNKNISVDDTTGIRKVVVPNLRPLDAIEWLAKRCVDEKGSANFIFFENKNGYNFSSLSKMLDLRNNPAEISIAFRPKNFEFVSAIDELYSPRSFEVVSQINFVEKTRSGVHAGKFIGFDPQTRTITTKTITYDDHFNKMTHSNKTKNVGSVQNRGGLTNLEMFDSKKTVATFSGSRKFSKYIQSKDPESISKEDNIEEYLFQRKAIIKNLMEKRLKLTMPGNFDLTSGKNVNITIPTMSQKEQGDTNDDETINGNYIIVGVRHIVGYEKHETIIEVATTTSELPATTVSSIPQTREIQDY